MRMALLCSRVVEGWAQRSPIQPSTARTSVAGRGSAGLLAPGPRGWWAFPAPGPGVTSAAWITQPQGREHRRVGPSRAGLPPRAQPPPPGSCGSSSLSPAPRAPWPRPPSGAQGGTAGGQPRPWGEHSFLTFLSGVWSLLKDGAAAWLLASVLFLSVFTEAACHPSRPQAHACVHTGPLAPEPQRASGGSTLGWGEQLQGQWPGGLGAAFCRTPERLGPLRASVLGPAHHVPAPVPFTWAACFQQSWPRPGEPQCLLPASVNG